MTCVFRIERSPGEDALNGLDGAVVDTRWSQCPAPGKRVLRFGNIKDEKLVFIERMIVFHAVMRMDVKFLRLADPRLRLPNRRVTDHQKVDLFLFVNLSGGNKSINKESCSADRLPV